MENLKDAAATTLLMSHVEYWENDLLPAVLAQSLTAVVLPPTRPPEKP